MCTCGLQIYVSLSIVYSFVSFPVTFSERVELIASETAEKLMLNSVQSHCAVCYNVRTYH